MTIRNAGGKFERDAAQARIDAEAAELRAKRWTLGQIAAHQGCSISTAHTRIKRAIAAVPYEAVNELRRLELESLDELEARVREVMLARHLRIDHGKVIEIDGVPLEDDSPVLQAADRILRIKDARAKLTGTYAPTRSRIEVITEDAVDAEIRRLEAEVAALDASGDRSATRETEAAG